VKSRKRKKRKSHQSLVRSGSHVTPPAAQMDRTILMLVLLLVGLGTVMVYSASSAVAASQFGDSAWYLKRHLARVVIGIGIMFILSRARFARVVRLGRPLLLFSFVALIVVLLPGIGGESNGAQRWLSLGPISFQPSELARFALLLWLVDMLVARRNLLDRFQEGFVPIIVPVATVVALIMLEDFSTAVAVALICAGLIALAGARLIHFGAITAAALPLAWIALMGSEYRRARILAFFDGGMEGSSGKGSDTVHRNSGSSRNRSTTSYSALSGRNSDSSEPLWFSSSSWLSFSEDSRLPGRPAQRPEPCWQQVSLSR